MKITEDQLIALVNYTNDSNSRDNVKRLTAQAKASEQGLTNNHHELLPHYQTMSESIRHMAEAGMTSEDIAKAALTLFIQPTGVSKTVADMLHDIRAVQ